MKALQIDIVSDVVCPWCAIGFAHLEAALKQINFSQPTNIQWHPFQLNPYMAKEGQEINEHLGEKYGLSVEQLSKNKQHIVQVGKDAGITLKFEQRARIYNTQDCHVLLEWAREQDKQTQLKLAFFNAYFSEGKDISDVEVLLDAVVSIGLDRTEAQAALNDTEKRQYVKDEELKYKSMGISSVPAFIINNKHLISGAQPVEVIKKALLEISQEP